MLPKKPFHAYGYMTKKNKQATFLFLLSITTQKWPVMGDTTSIPVYLYKLKIP
jgi:hypothetical protein